MVFSWDLMGYMIAKALDDGKIETGNPLILDGKNHGFL